MNGYENIIYTVLVRLHKQWGTDIHILIHIIFRNMINYLATKEEGYPGLNSLPKINGRET